MQWSQLELNCMWILYLFRYLSKDTYNKHSLPQYPLGVGKEFTGVCDLVTMDVIMWGESDGSYKREAIDTCLNVSRDLLSEVKQAQSKLVEEVVHSSLCVHVMFGVRTGCHA